MLATRALYSLLALQWPNSRNLEVVPAADAKLLASAPFEVLRDEGLEFSSPYSKFAVAIEFSSDSYREQPIPPATGHRVQILPSKGSLFRGIPPAACFLPKDFCPSSVESEQSPSGDTNLKRVK
jgi:hypothetical protein